MPQHFQHPCKRSKGTPFFFFLPNINTCHNQILKIYFIFRARLFCNSPQIVIWSIRYGLLLKPKHSVTDAGYLFLSSLDNWVTEVGAFVLDLQMTQNSKTSLYCLLSKQKKIYLFKDKQVKTFQISFFPPQMSHPSLFEAEKEFGQEIKGSYNCHDSRIKMSDLSEKIFLTKYFVSLQPQCHIRESNYFDIIYDCKIL